MLHLHHYRLCPQSRGVRLLLAELKAETTLVDERPWEWSAERAALNPSGELPILVDQSKSVVIAGSYAIIEFLSDTNPVGSVLARDTLDRAEMRRIIDWYHGLCQRTVTGPLLEAKVYDRFRSQEKGAAPPDAGTLRTIRSNLRYQLRYLDHLTEQRNWLGGDALSAADFVAAGHVSVLDYLDEISWAEISSAKTWYARMKSRPAMRALLAERVPGAAAPPAYYADPDF
jgi:glutathione S-transferase